MPFPIGRTADKHEEWLNPIPGSRRGEGNAVPEEGERQIVSLLYELIENGYDKRAGVLYAPSGWPCPLAVDTMEVKNWQNLRVELRDGKYCSFHECDAGANMVSEELKDLLLSFIGENENIPQFGIRKFHKKLVI